MSQTATSTDLHAPPLAAAAAGQLLAEVVDRARRGADGAVVVFDLDSTLLDNSPRQARIMREYGEERDVPALAGVQADHWRGWDARIPMRNVGLSPADVDVHYQPFREYWWHRFFSSELCVEDRPIPGAVRYAQAVRDSGARLFYVTGRHELMRPGTLECFRRHELPFPDKEGVVLLMKPTLDEHDDDYKHRTYQALRDSGEVVAAFDNEPAHINGYFQAFPEACSVHLATDHSLRPIRVLAGIPSIRDFTAWSHS